MSQHLLRRPSPPAFASRLRLMALNPPRDILYQRINERTERMFQHGWVEEVRKLMDGGVPASAKALGAHGYRRIVQYLRDEISLARAVELTQQDVRHYAKRQITWFRREPHITWFNGFGEDPSLQSPVIAQILHLFSESA